jgi:hypothetical protein
MSVPELVIAIVFAGLGVRSAVWWLRRPFETADVRDNLLFAAYLTGRVGLWFALSGFFLLIAVDRPTRLGVGDATGGGFADGAFHYRWFVLVFLGLAAIKFVATQFLAHRLPR